VDEKLAIELFLATKSEEAFCAFFESVYGRVRRYFLLRGVDAMIAEDLAQNVLFIVYQRAEEIRDKDLFQGWLFAVARNELMRYWRQSRSRIETVELEPHSARLAENLAVEPPMLRDSRFQD
jgi:RNA polymerase sigma-70 factor (ECF subfamily)